MVKADWEFIETLLMIRSGGRCEARTPECLAGSDGNLAGLPRHLRSFHHRKPRGMGGTSRADVHSMAALVSVCGHGTTGCHGYIERHRQWAYSRGLLVSMHAVGDLGDPEKVPLVLPGGRRVLLVDDSSSYGRAPDPEYDLAYQDAAP